MTDAGFEVTVQTEGLDDYICQLRKEIGEKMVAMSVKTLLNDNNTTGPSDITNTVTSTPKLRQDARLMQILHGVKAGTIAVEDAALEIIEGRGLDRRSFLATNQHVLTHEQLEKMREELRQQWPDKVTAHDDLIDATVFGMPVVPMKTMPKDTVLLRQQYGIDLAKDGDATAARILAKIQA